MLSGGGAGEGPRAGRSRRERRKYMASEELEKEFRTIFSMLKTRKKFVFKELRPDGKLIVEREDEICGQKENQPYTFNTPHEFKKFVSEMNQEEINYQKTLESNEMPYR